MAYIKIAGWYINMDHITRAVDAGPDVELHTTDGARMVASGAEAVALRAWLVRHTRDLTNRGGDEDQGQRAPGD